MSSLFSRFFWALVQSYPDSNWRTDPGPWKMTVSLPRAFCASDLHWSFWEALSPLSHLTYTLSHILISLSSLFFRFLWGFSEVLRGISIKPNILSKPPRNANVKSFLHFFYGRSLVRLLQGFSKSLWGASEDFSENFGELLGKLSLSCRLNQQGVAVYMNI